MMRECVFCSGKASMVDTDSSSDQEIWLTFCCKQCDRSFVEIFEYSRTETSEGDPVEIESSE